MTIENIKNLFENLRLGFYNGDNYRVEIFNHSNYFQQITIDKIDSDSFIRVGLIKNDVKFKDPEYIVKVQFATTGYECTFKIDKETFVNFQSYITEEATRRELLADINVQEAFQL